MDDRPTTTETTTRIVRWVTVALAAGASLLHWIGGQDVSHEITAAAVLAVVAGTSMMALAVLVAVAPWRDLESPAAAVRLARAVLLAGATLTAALASWSFLAVLAGAGGTGHAAHATAHSEASATLHGAVAIIEVAVAAALVWMFRRAHRDVTGRT